MFLRNPRFRFKANQASVDSQPCPPIMGGSHKAPNDHSDIRRHHVVFIVLLLMPLLFVATCFSVFLSNLHATNRKSLILPALEFVTANRCKCNGELDATAGKAVDVVSGRNVVEQLVGEKETNPLRVFVYDLPSNFTSDFYNHPDATKTPYASEWWIYKEIMQDPSERDTSVAVRVTDPSEADVFFVPFMASQAFNCDRREHFLRHNFEEICGSAFGRDHALQAELLSWLEAQAPWQRSGGIDHVVMAVHPLALNRIDEFLAPCAQLLVDFVFKHSSKAGLEKDIIVPHSHLVEWLPDDQVESATSPRFLETAENLLYFAGVLDRKGMGVLRSSLRDVLKDEPGVVITGPKRGAGQADLTDSAVDSTAIAMRRSKFCLDPAGDTPSSSRLFDAIVNLCIPVIISDDLEIPFEGQMDLRKSCIFVKESDAVQPGLLVSQLRAISDEEILSKKRELAKIRQYFAYIDAWRRKDSAPTMVWREITARLPLIKLRMARRNRGVSRPHASTYDKMDQSRLMKGDR